MLKFTFLLWMMEKLIKRTIRTKPAAAAYVRGKTLTFQIRTADGTGRHYRIANGTISSAAGLADAPAFTLAFATPADGFRILTAKDSKGAFLQGLHERTLVLSGDFVAIMWFQGLTDFL
ncbi:MULTISPECIES: hypothetical protein [unclassified Sphingomonas]|jgi:hypothetical protein|uniref:hypothetical protein n=1 Tax=unclassified Sphingomonas TaxID=196159 RepID=UPI0025D58DD9|nr:MULTISPECIES: hypothetical protein [unclassified Sphingomonas]